eukprot:CAMPEP_0169276628 /NCGR_PEP_ID=MMETSP1016-20121227/53142_1 /TAXON_ID=342587 /ORGANISM="Karlodinium micrum, Strain CCMP2283" /LENGTH=99 /DNA_ID=CAMNT_0009363833 /DNA_START=40 /DNA_END=339 /DNA_ORIENTATION=+
MRIPKTYIQSLDDSRLVSVLAGYLGCEGLSDEDVAYHLTVKFHATTEKEILGVASDIGDELEREGWQIECADSTGHLLNQSPFPPVVVPPPSYSSQGQG